MAKTVALLDYGAGNVRSAQRALERVGAEVAVTADPKAAVDADGLLVPGVGAFDACMRGLNGFRGQGSSASAWQGSGQCWVFA